MGGRFPGILSSIPFEPGYKENNMSFSKSSRKSSSAKAAYLTSMIESLAPKTTQQPKGKDERFWIPGKDKKTGNGYAVIRFLPSVDEDSGKFPWVEGAEHYFQGSGGWYIKPCSKPSGGKCPACEYNVELTKAGGGYDLLTPSDKTQYSKIRAKKKYFVNVLVLENDHNPESVGKVLVWKIGPMLWKKIESAFKPEFPDDIQFNPFDLNDGANFKLKIKKKDNFPDYSSSTFEDPSPLYNGDEDQQRKVRESSYNLEEFITIDSPEKHGYIDSTEVLAERLNKATGVVVNEPTRAPSPRVDPIDELKSQITSTDSSDEEPGDMLSFFEKMAKDK
jgi:hypothetical protein